MTKFLYQGHGSYRITSSCGKVIYVDPYAGEGYGIPADIVLITHQHGDHNKTELVERNPGCVIITNSEALKGGEYKSFSVDGVEIEAVEAYNSNHDPDQCVGYVISLDGIGIYASGDTSRTRQMESLAERKLDYAILCCDGQYNMGLEEALECAGIIGARHNIPVHMKPGELFDQKLAEEFKAPGKLILKPGQEINLE